jgi:hypothetical protein
MVVDNTTTSAATRRLSHNAFMKSELEKNFTNQRSVTPTGGNAIYGVGLSANTSTMAIGISRKKTMAPLAVR